MSNKYSASIKINRTRAVEVKSKRYDTEDHTAWENDDLLELEVKADTLEGLQAKIKAHVDLVEDWQ